ncbi:hypothetical protein POM88_033361 [Heracleum sosnowskyi]|uniref:Transmembrane protein n=1 Tax=Heracleum sosnowskyi TaxID=360622 RepID=A0AAD8I1Z0_9APIA|nr:hypothetical protein POM88_033361 [Heracleum sosnowskyi]
MGELARYLLKGTKFGQRHDKVIYRVTTVGFYATLSAWLWVISSKDEPGSYKNRLCAWITRLEDDKQRREARELLLLKIEQHSAEFNLFRDDLKKYQEEARRKRKETDAQIQALKEENERLKKWKLW